jgi:uncharacterized coiled-coil protein SlyX
MFEFADHGAVAVWVGVPAMIAGALGFAAVQWVVVRIRRPAVRIVGTGFSSAVPPAPLAVASELDRARHMVAEADRAIAVLQADHDRLNSLLAQHARRVMTLEGELITHQTEAARAIAALERSIVEHKQALAAALLDVDRLTTDLGHVRGSMVGQPAADGRQTPPRATP